MMIAAQVPLIVLCAPAGFGKTCLASAYAQRFESRACLLARHGLSSKVLLGELSERADCIVLEDADRLDEPAWREVTERLLAGQHEGSVLVVCCRREPLTFSFADVIEQYSLLVLRVPELELTLNETRGLAAQVTIDEPVIRAVYDLAQGWPVPTLSLIELCERGLFGDSRSSIRPALEDLFDWLEIEVLDALPSEVRETLFRCVASRDLTANDLRRIRRAQLVSVGVEGEVLPNPLIAMLLQDRHESELDRCYEDG